MNAKRVVNYLLKGSCILDTDGDHNSMPQSEN